MQAYSRSSGIEISGTKFTLVETSSPTQDDRASMLSMICQGLGPYTVAPGLLLHSKRTVLSNRINQYIIVRDGSDGIGQHPAGENISTTIVGFAMFRPNASRIHICELFVREGFQSLGIGSFMVTRLRDSNSRVPITLTVYKANKRAQELYAKLGFTTNPLAEQNRLEMTLHPSDMGN